ncbi:MAG: hypothetical protein M0Q42_01130 [Xanthomonadales bacterium]|nr:hypothetical protein [Xanthomonadales bacterium]
MSTLDLDKLRGQWARQTRRIDDSLVLDLDTVRARLQRKVVTTFAWHRRRRLAGLVIGGGVLVALLAFMAGHWQQGQWLALAALLLPLLLAELVIDVREWLALRRLDLTAPVMQVRQVLHRLRWRRLRLAKGYLLLSLLLWWPFVLVLFKGLFGVDLLQHLPASVFWVNLVVGVAFIPVAWLVAWALDRRFGHSPGWQRFLDDSAGMTWRRASDAVAEQASFEAAASDGSLSEAASFDALPEAIHAHLRALRRHLLLGIIGCAALIVVFGLFNASHGGQPRFIIAATGLLWCALAHMVVQILNRQALSRLDGGVIGLRERLQAMIALRRRFALATVALSPFMALLAALVVAKVLGMDLTVVLPAAAQIGAGGLALVASAVLWHCIRHDPQAFAPRLIDAVSLGFIGRARGLLATLQRERE